MNAPDPSPNSLSRLVDLGPLRVKAKHLVDGECSLGGDDLSVVAGGVSEGVYEIGIGAHGFTHIWGMSLATP